ncbi:serine hydroxymethyltransferase [Candidatus Saccharibacteria bacterium RIFCSPHIGHO2_12_FULL_48_21]|nr:MAG: serine hydroxymethyltransferase [Candidatus Saccharibacteria bacterium RIFCSPHIGHO2_12_FULL_48_21]
MTDKDVAALIDAEEKRQREGLELIPSENYVSRDVLTAMGSVFTNKYSEGFPGKRYYGGQINTDKVEQLAIDRAKKLFGCDHANVQSHSGAPANEAVYHAWCEPGDTIMGMELSHGGHLTHGRPGTISAKLFNFVRYGIKDMETGEIDYEQMRSVAKKTKPKIIIAGFSSYPRELDYAKFAAIGQEVGAVLMADMAHIAGLIAGKALANPFGHGFHIITTTTHKTLRGPRGAMILSQGDVSNPLKPVDKEVKNLPTLIDRSVFPGIQGGPHMHIIAAKAVALGEAGTPQYRKYCQQILKNSKALAEQMMKLGFKLVTNGTDNHLILADVKTSFGLDGGEVEEVLDKIGLTLNKNVIPDDPLPPFRPSGIRLGTPAITTRGLKEKDMEMVAKWMHQAIKNRKDTKILNKLSNEVKEFCLQFPLPSDDQR